MATQETDKDGKGATAPYISYQTLKTVAKHMNEHGIPNRIDRSVFSNLSGGVVAQLLPAMKFLGLTDNEGNPTDYLKDLVSSSGSDAWGGALAEMLASAYSPLFDLNLEAASPQQFDQVFRQLYAGTDDVARKSKTFFLNAAQDAGIKISPYILKGKKSRSGSTKKRGPKASGRSAPVVDRQEDNPPPSYKVQPEKKSSEILLSFFNPEMGQAEQDAIWTLIKHFKAKDE